MLTVCRGLRTVFLSENIGGNRIFSCADVVCDRLTEWVDSKYLKLLGKNNPSYRHNDRLRDSFFYVYAEKIQEKRGIDCQGETAYKHHDCLCIGSGIFRINILLSGIYGILSDKPVSSGSNRVRCL